MNDQVKAVLWEDIFAGDGEMEALMRRLKALRDLALQTSGAKTELEACRIAADILSAHPGDVSFALLYLLDRTQTEQAQLLETVGCEPGTLASPLRVDTASPGIWPFDTVLKTGQAVVATDLSHRMSCPSPVSWSEPPHTALVLPITPSGQSQPAGFLVAGISSQLVLDDEYRTFLELVAGQIATAVAKARAEEERTQADALAELDRAKTAFFSPVSHEFLTPITLDPKLAEDALADTEQPLSPQQRERINEAARAQVIDVLESITDGFFSLDSRWRLTYVNQATERLSGKTRGELLGRSIWEVYPGLIGSTFDEQIRRAVREQVAVHFETPSVHAGIWREVHAYPHQNGLSIYWRDITNRKQAEEALRRREEELRLLADAVPALISYVDRDRCFRFVNRAYTDWFGHPAEEIIGQTVEEFVGETAYQHMRPHVEAALAGESVTVEMWIPFQAGGPRYVRRQYIPDLNERGEVKGFYALINDLTTLKQADAERERLLQELQTERARFEAVLQQMPAGVMIADAASGKLILTNEQAKQMIGYAYEQSLVIEEYEPIVPFEGFRLDSQRYAPEEYPLARSLRTGEVVANEEMKLHRGDGRCIFMSVNSAPILDNQEQIVAAVVVFQDVTARKQVEENLRLSENRYRTLANAVSQLMWINDVNGNIQLFNQRWQEYTGVEDLELGVGLWRDIIHPDDFHSTLEKRTQAIQAGEAYELECRLKRFDQTYRWHLARIVPLKDEEGRVLQWYGTATDIHYVKQIEADLRESEAIARARAQELETLMEITPAALWIAHDPNCHHMSANQMAYELMRATPGSVTTATPPDGSYLLQFKQKRNGQEVPPYDLPMQRAARTGQEVTDEMEFIFEDGTVRFIYGKAVPLRNETGDVRGVIGAFVDITERKRVEETLRENQERLSIAQQAGRLGVFDVDLRTDENVWSLEMQALYGLQPGEFDGTYQAWLGSLHPDDREKAQRELERALKTGEYAEDFRVIWPDGSIHWLYSRATIFFDAAGNPLRMLGVNVDISDRKQAEREREQLLARERVAREEAEAANRIKDEFLAVLSHELRSPLNPILGWAKLLRSRRLDEQATTRALETIERNAKLQAQLIEDLLDVSRILRGKLVLNVAPVNLAATIEAALETMRLAAEAKGIQIQTVLAPNVGRVKGDSARLQQVVWNLLSNAIKFTPTGGRVEVRLKQVDKYAQIQVKDKGKGITTEFLPHVFEYFRQADGTTTRQFGGLGLGLAIVRHLVELHGGSVQAESPGEGLGATFTVKLPLIENVPENNPHDRQDAATDLSGVRVLVVDDEADMRELVAFILEESGAEVQVAASATEALEKLEQFQQDILISDIGMPHVDGYMLMQQVRERFPQHGRPSPALSQAMPKAIALTAYAGEFNQQQALAAGFERHLSKPVEPNELVRAIATLVNR